MIKRFTSILLFMASTAYGFAQQSGHIFKDLRGSQCPTESVEDSFKVWFSMEPQSKLVRVSDKTDDLGFRQVGYLQYHDQVLVDGSYITVHSKDGWVTVVNGAVMGKNEYVANQVKTKGEQLKSVEVAGDVKIVPFVRNGVKQYRKAFERKDYAKGYLYQIDVENADTLNAISLRHYADVQGKGHTMYSGEVVFPVSEDGNGGYILKSELVNGLLCRITTKYAGNIFSVPDNTLATEYADMCTDYVSPTPDFGSELQYIKIKRKINDEWLNYGRITNVLIQGVNKDSYGLESAPDIYIVIKDENGNVKYKSEVKEDAKLPLLINIDKDLICEKGWTMSIYDEDVVNDQLIYGCRFLQFNDSGILFWEETDGNEGVIGFKKTATSIDVYNSQKNKIGTTTFESCSKMDTLIGWFNLTPKFTPKMLDKGSHFELSDVANDGIDYGVALNINDVTPNYNTVSKERYEIEYYLSGNPALDAHWGMFTCLSFYLEKFNRLGYNNKGSNVYLFVDSYYGSLSDGQENAFSTEDANGVCFMCFGRGGEEMTPVVALDVMAHEYTHSVIRGNGNLGLLYQGESGALNESFADIMGTGVEWYAKGDKANWTIGEDMMKNCSNMRDMSNPKNGKDGAEPQPDYYKGQYWVNTEDMENDKGGVHTNSGVQNFWFYLLSEGGSGMNENGDLCKVEGVGIEKALQIAYRNMITYLIAPSAAESQVYSEANYSDAVHGSMSAAADLYGKGSREQKSVYDAWCAVGLCFKEYEALFDDDAVEDIANNPTSFTIFTQNGNVSVQSKKDGNVKISDLQGKTLYEKNVKAGEWNTFAVGAGKVVMIESQGETQKTIVK